ncbi:MAG: LPS-assembly protein LptD, partial [Gammaproteobacteria bacterium]
MTDGRATVAEPADQELPEAPIPVFPPPKPKSMPAPPPRSVARRPGWTCNANEEDETWACSLVGPDPKGQARLVEGDEHRARIIESAFNLNQEQLFKMMQTDLQYDPWQTCDWSKFQRPDFSEEEALRKSTPLDVNADFSEIFDKEITSFAGNVDIVRADQHIEADMATYDSVSDTMDAQGNVYYRDSGVSLYSDTALLKLDTNQSVLRDVLFVSPETRGRGTAKVAYRDSRILSRYKEVAYTSCEPGNQDWVLHASRLKINKHTGKASAKHAWLEFKGVPILYTPYISYPIDDRRQSGLLAPTFATRQATGFDIIVPYYFNLAPNYDATFKPRILTKRGLMLAGDFRYLTESSKGIFDAEYLPYDAERKKVRGQLAWDHETRFTPHLLADIDANWVSDDEYIDELRNSLGFSNTRYLRSRGDVRYQREGISFLSRVENYQTIDSNIETDEKPYRKLPQVRLDLNRIWHAGGMPIYTFMDNEVVNFHKSDYEIHELDAMGEPTANLVNVTADRGMRLDIKPGVTLPLEGAGKFLKPRFSLQHTQYWLEEREGGLSEDLSRTLPIFSVDSGLFFERAFRSGLVHTLEPRLFYLYIPYQDQSDFPDFDTSDYDFNFNQLFRENSFSGADRVQNANQVTAALTTRFLDSESGLERLRLSLGQIFYFEDRKVLLITQRDNESDSQFMARKERQIDKNSESFSNFIAEMSGQLTNEYSFLSGVQWDPYDSKFDRSYFTFRYRSLQDQIFNIGYRYRKNSSFSDTDDGISQSDVSFIWPIYDDWNLLGRWQYSLEDGKTVESFLGFEKDGCCWRFRILGRRYVNRLDSNPQTGIFVQLELKGLTNFGDKVE